MLALKSIESMMRLPIQLTFRLKIFFSSACVLLFLLLPCSTLCAQKTSTFSEQVKRAKAYEKQGLRRKALKIYTDLYATAHKKRVYEAYFQCMLALKEYTRIEKVLQQEIKAKNELRLQVDLLLLWRKMDSKQANIEQTLTELIERTKNESAQLKRLAFYLTDRGMYEEAIKAYKAGEKVAKKPGIYTSSMANLYFRMGRIEDGMHEHLRHLILHPNYLAYVKRLIKTVHKSRKQLLILEKTLMRHTQLAPDSRVLLDIFVWLQIEMKNYEKAFQLAAATDRRTPLGASFFMKIGEKAARSDAYQAAMDIFLHVKNTYPSSSSLRSAHYQYLYAKECLYLRQKPLKKAQLIDLAQNYRDFLAQNNRDTQSIEAREKLALLYAKYFHKSDSAIILLKKNLQATRSFQEQKWHIRNKYALAEAYLLAENFWEAILLYAQIAQTSKDPIIREKAQFERAKTSYYQEAFALAKAQLDVLKHASSKYTSNDALLLSDWIGSYLHVGDSASREPLRILARADLAMRGGKIAHATALVEKLLTTHPNPSGLSHILYLLAQFKCKTGEYQAALEPLDDILQANNPILFDKALCLKGDILAQHIEDFEAAALAYQRLIRDFPKSVYLPQARRSLRSIAARSEKLPQK